MDQCGCITGRFVCFANECTHNVGVCVLGDMVKDEELLLPLEMLFDVIVHSTFMAVLKRRCRWRND